MPYVDQTFYTDTYKGEAISEVDFAMFEARASEMIDSLTMYRVAMSVNKLADWPELTQTQFKKAVCAQIEFINANGGTELYTADNMQSAGLGKFNYSNGNSSKKPKLYSDMVEIYLCPTGLLYRGL